MSPRMKHKERIGVGASDHPAPATTRDPDGRLHVAGEIPGGATFAGTEAGVDIPSPEVGSGAMDDETRAKLNAEHEPEQVETDRPDIGTPE